MNKKPLYDYPKLIRLYREINFLTQSQLTEFLGVKLVTISRWETGRFEPNMQMKKKLALLLAAALVVGTLGACGSSSSTSAPAADGGAA